MFSTIPRYLALLQMTLIPINVPAEIVPEILFGYRLLQLFKVLVHYNSVRDRQTSAVFRYDLSTTK